ncbi:MAG: helix-turn-helix transcriptional regulator, partial [Nitrospira sp.]|nr:helix-turn-helix transcriptional regulator [Nitrospira sp.]
FELLIPHITNTIKSLLLSDENFEYENLTTLISNRLYPVALVTKSGKVSFCNDAFTKVFKVTKKENLPLRLFREFSFESEKFEKPHDMKTPLDGKKIELPEGIFILQLSLIDGKHSKTENRYFLELNPLIEPGSDFERTMKRKNLNRTERLVCALVRDGKSNQEIADIMGETLNNANYNLRKLNEKFNSGSNRNRLIYLLNKL